MASQIRSTIMYAGISYTATIGPGGLTITADRGSGDAVVAVGEWTGRWIECDVVLGGDRVASDTIYQALEDGLRLARPSRSDETTRWVT